MLSHGPKGMTLSPSGLCSRCHWVRASSPARRACTVKPFAISLSECYLSLSPQGTHTGTHVPCHALLRTHTQISDQGGGIPRSAVPRMFSYLYTTARSPLPDVDPDDDSYQNLPVVLAGYGCGLSLSRLVSQSLSVRACVVCVCVGGWVGRSLQQTGRGRRSVGLGFKKCLCVCVFVCVCAVCSVLWRRPTALQHAGMTQCAGTHPCMCLACALCIPCINLCMRTGLLCVPMVCISVCVCVRHMCTGVRYRRVHSPG